MTRKNRTCLYIFAMLIPALFSACAFLPKEEPVLPPPLIYSYERAENQLVTVARGDVVLAVDVNVTYVPARQETLRFKLSGILIKSIGVAVGDEVAAGQVLAELDRDEIVARIAQMRHDLEMLEIAMRQLGEEESLGRRMEALLGTPDDGSWRRRRDELQGRIDIMTLKLENLLAQDAERVIVAGIDGVITSAKSFTEGEYSSEGASIVTVTDKSFSVFKASGSDARHFREGATAVITVGGTEYDGAVVAAEEIGLPADDQIAYIQLVDPVLTVAGSYGMVHIVLDQRADVLYLPSNAVKTANEKPFVYMLDDNGVRIARDVVTGLAGNGVVEIISGVNEGDVVLLR